MHADIKDDDVSSIASLDDYRNRNSRVQRTGMRVTAWEHGNKANQDMPSYMSRSNNEQQPAVETEDKEVQTEPEAATKQPENASVAAEVEVAEPRPEETEQERNRMIILARSQEQDAEIRALQQKIVAEKEKVEAVIEEKGRVVAEREAELEVIKKKHEKLQEAYKREQNDLKKFKSSYSSRFEINFNDTGLI